jgi:hypothetical protein
MVRRPGFLVLTLLAAPLLAQVPAGPLATWSDLETWSAYDAEKNETDVGLGLQPVGEAGPMLVAFTARLPGKRAAGRAREITVRVAASARSNPNVIRRPELRFQITGGLPDAHVLDLSGRLRVDDPAPGAAVDAGSARITLAELEAIGRAQRLAASVLGAAVAFRTDQIRAIAAFGERIGSP